MATSQIKHFTDLETWKKAHNLVLETYRIASTLPDSERFGLISQMTRAAVSITSNIAEGFNRQSMKEKMQFYSVSLGSVSELENQFMIIRDLGYANSDTVDTHIRSCQEVHRMINALIKGAKGRVYA